MNMKNQLTDTLTLYGSENEPYAFLPLLSIEGALKGT
jgi:ABC-type transporter lipoprotein component MlaA